jgi:hypothetical protein
MVHLVLGRIVFTRGTIFGSGFPLASGTYRTKRRDPSAAIQHLARKSVRRERQDPDVEIAPSGFPEPAPERCVSTLEELRMLSYLIL